MNLYFSIIFFTFTSNMQFEYSCSGQAFQKVIGFNRVSINVEYLRFQSGINIFHHPEFTQLWGIDTLKMKILFVDSDKFQGVVDLSGSIVKNLETIVFTCSGNRFWNNFNDYNNRNVVVLCRLTKRVLNNINRSAISNIFVIKSLMNDFENINKERVHILQQNVQFIEQDNMSGVKISENLESSCSKLIQELELDFYLVNGNYFPVSTNAINVQLKTISCKHQLLTAKLITLSLQNIESVKNYINNLRIFKLLQNTLIFELMDQYI